MDDNDFERMVLDIGNEIAELLFCHLGMSALYSVVQGKEATRKVREACTPINQLVNDAARP